MALGDRAKGPLQEAAGYCQLEPILYPVRRLDVVMTFTVADSRSRRRAGPRFEADLRNSMAAAGARAVLMGAGSSSSGGRRSPK